jgi:sugar/nucleoside kinase (ribokinase family)
MYDLITLGDIVVDLFYRGESLTEEKDRFNLAMGGKYFVDGFYETLGGGGCNVAVGCARHNLVTAVCGMVGENNFKQIIVQTLAKRNVSTEFLMYQKDYLNISSILLSKEGEKTVINYQTPQHTFSLHSMFHETILKTKWLYMGNLPSLDISEKIKLLQMFKEKGIKIALNIGVEDCRQETAAILDLITMSDIFIVNTHEFSDILKKDISKIDFTKDMLKELKIKNTLVITDGEKGSYAYKNGNVYQESPVKTQIVDTTGAGDAYVSGFLSTYISSQDIQQSMKSGAIYASEVISKIGAQ